MPEYESHVQQLFRREGLWAPNQAREKKRVVSIYRFRKQHGVNLGSWFVLERWITDAPFHCAVPPAKTHYDSWITESDWAWISNRGINTVRIPIGYYHLCGADESVLSGTDFQDLFDVFSGAWARLIQAIETARRFGIGRFCSNPDAHAGTSNPAAFFSDQRSRMHTIHVLRIELLNEPHPSSDAELKTWYSVAIKDISALDPTLPIYLGDCWKTDQYAEYIKSKSTPHSSLLVLDHHLYRCFTSSDISNTASTHAHALADERSTTPRILRCAGLVVGEWSGALNPGSLTGSPDDLKNYVGAQLKLYEAHCSGNFFWTYKKAGHHPDPGWCLRDAVDSGVFPSRVGLFALRSSEDDHERQAVARDKLKNKALGEHTAYWSKYPGKYRHERFAEGFAVGWDDAYIFFAANSRLDRPTRTNDQSSFWEFRKQGVNAARNDFRKNYC
ncbi:glycoside hydrolase superfamily [Mycena olivaceomarginata]|nr:glycoside hydrolase superfamily [Mycena olivaceomarginata]